MSHTVTLRCRCRACRAVHWLGLRIDTPIERELATQRCPTCRKQGAMRIVRSTPPPPPRDSTRVGMYDEPPDMEGDEPLIEHMERMRT